MKKKVTKAVIPIAGFGVRFLPATKSVPKELLPIVDKPLLLYNLEELSRAGIKEVLLVDSPYKDITKDFFKPNQHLNQLLKKQEREHYLDSIIEIQKKMNIQFGVQEEPLGLGHAVLCAKKFVNNDPFALILGDEILFTPENQKSILQELIAHYQETSLSTVSIMKVDPLNTHKYGIVEGHEETHKIKINNLVEKPAPDKAPSSWALPGRYVFGSEIFTHLENIPKGKGGEYQLTDAMCLLAKNQGLWGIKMDPIKNKRYDAGDKLGYVIANIEYGLRHPEIGPSLKEYINANFKN